MAEPFPSGVREVGPREAFELLRSDPDARLVDVRLPSEIEAAGRPSLAALGKPVLAAPWPAAPGMTMEAFMADIAGGLPAGTPRDAPLLFICRSGGRSRAAAELMAALGWAGATNVAHGYSGHPWAPEAGWEGLGLPVEPAAGGGR